MNQTRAGQGRAGKSGWRRSAVWWCWLWGSMAGGWGGLPGLQGQGFSLGIKSGGSDNPADYAVVVYNRNDPLSHELADFYAEKRGINPKRVVALDCPVQEDISREDYDATIAAPLRAAFDANDWWERTPDRSGSGPASTVLSNHIRFLVLIRGVPLRIMPTNAPYEGDFQNDPPPMREQNAACVDSELAALGLFSRKISGLLPNPAFRSYARFSEGGRVPGMMYTGRLDAPDGTTVRRMVEDALAVEKTGLWGRCYVDARGMEPGSNPLAMGDRWMTKIASEIAPGVLPTVFDDKEAQFPVAYPLEDAALYFGWYSQQPAGPFTRPEVRFRPGAVACHIHSFSATSLRDPGKWWVAPLLDHGAAAALGNVYEPYLGLTTHLDLFAARLVDGYTLAESAWQGTPALSWMNTVVGDPLYRPGKVWQDLKFDLGSGPAAQEQPALVAEGEAYFQGAQVWRNKGAEAGAAALEESAARLHSGLVYEGLGGYAAGVGDTALAVRAYAQAVKLYENSGDRVRVILSEAAVLNKAGQKPEAEALLINARRNEAGNPAAAALDEP